MGRTSSQCIAVGLFAVAIGFVDAAEAQPAADWAAKKAGYWELCDRSWWRPDEAIAGCTALIHVGQGDVRALDRRGLAEAFYHRGNAYMSKHDYDRGIADFSDAIKVDGSNAGYYKNRAEAFRGKSDDDRALADEREAMRLYLEAGDKGNASGIFSNWANRRSTSGDYPRAVADLTEAIRLDPHGLYYFARGVANVYAGSLPDALADLNKASDLLPGNRNYLFAALWLDIVAKRSNLPSQLAARLAARKEKIDVREWPAPIIRLYLGIWNPEAVIAAAKNSSDLCEANFYSGELSLQRKAKAEATRLFRLVTANCPTYSTEWSAANAELKALGGQ